jgi:hypothetical protein
MRARAFLVSTAVPLLLFFLYSHGYGKSADTQVKGNAQSQPRSAPATLAIYASDPDHIWNRLFRLFYVRHADDGQQYGGDELDPYLWEQTKYLLSGSSHDEALKLLDEFLEQHAERAVTDPLKRALFQRDLLAVYDWLALPGDEQTQNRSELQKRVAEIIRRLALSEDQIRKLPDNYEDAVRAHAFPTTYDPATPSRRSFPMIFSTPRGHGYALGNNKDTQLPPTISNFSVEDQSSLSSFKCPEEGQTHWIIWQSSATSPRHGAPTQTSLLMSLGWFRILNLHNFRLGHGWLWFARSC